MTDEFYRKQLRVIDRIRETDPESADQLLAYINEYRGKASTGKPVSDNTSIVSYYPELEPFISRLILSLISDNVKALKAWQRYIKYPESYTGNVSRMEFPDMLSYVKSTLEHWRSTTSKEFCIADMQAEHWDRYSYPLVMRKYEMWELLSDFEKLMKTKIDLNSFQSKYRL